MSFMHDHDWQERRPILAKVMRGLLRAGEAVAEVPERFIARVQERAIERSTSDTAYDYLGGDGPTGALGNVEIPPRVGVPRYSGPTGSFGASGGVPTGAVSLPRTEVARVARRSGHG